MIQKFEEFVNERLFNGGVQRATAGGERLEDKLKHNIDTLKEIDLGLPFVFADEDVCIEDKKLFSWYDAVAYKELFAKYGWRMMTQNDFNKSRLSDRDCFTTFPDGDKQVSLMFYNDSSKKITFDAITWSGTSVEWRTWIYSEGGYFLVSNKLRSELYDSNRDWGVTCRVRLVRDKKKSRRK